MPLQWPWPEAAQSWGRDAFSFSPRLLLCRHRKAVYKLEVAFLVELEKRMERDMVETAVSNLCCVKFTVCIFHVPLDSVDVIISAFSFLFLLIDFIV